MRLICLTLLIISEITDSRSGNYSHPYKELKCVFMSIHRPAELYIYRSNYSLIHSLCDNDWLTVILHYTMSHYAIYCDIV